MMKIDNTSNSKWFTNNLHENDNGSDENMFVDKSNEMKRKSTSIIIQHDSCKTHLIVYLI